MSRLQAGGLALLLKTSNPNNLMKTVKLIRFIGQDDSCFHGVRGDYWEVYGADCEIYNPYNIRVIQPAEYLLPLGDEGGRKLYKLEEELINDKLED